MLNRRMFLRGVALASAAGLLAACGGEDDDDDQPSGGGDQPTTEPATSASPATSAGASTAELIIAQDTDAVTMDPMMTHTSETFVVLENMFEALIDWGVDGEIVPVLAESWEQVDNQTLEFILRSGVTFHNGEEFNADAVKFSLDRVLVPEIVSPATAYFKRAGIASEVIDATTVRVTTTQPYAATLPTLTQAYIVPPGYLEEVGEDEFAQAPVGTGPYTFGEWVKDQRVVLERNDAYWGGAPQIATATFRPIPEPSSRLAALQVGEVDFISNVPLDNYADVEQGEDTQLIIREGSQLYLGLQQLRPPFDDRRVRQAVNHAVDVESIISGLMLGRVTRLPGAVFPGTLGFDPALEPYAYDPDQARQLLSEAGYPDGFDTELFYAPNLGGTSKLEELAEVIAEQLSAVGINVKLTLLEIAAFNQRIPTGDYPMYFYVWTSPAAAAQYLELLFSSKTRGWYFQDPAADELIDEYFAALDDAERETIGRELNQYLFDEAPWLFLFQYPYGYGLRKDVTWDGLPPFVRSIEIARITKE